VNVIPAPVRSHRHPPRRGLDVLARAPWLERLMQARWFPVVLTVPLLLGLVMLLTAGVWGASVGSHNGLIVGVWIAWWVVLMAVLVPLASRSWCAVCPIPFFGDWLQRRTLLGVRGAGGAPQGTGLQIGRNVHFGLGRRWPRPLRNLWLQSAGFLLLATFSAVLLTDPFVSALAIGGLVVLATVAAAVFRQRTFCRFLCPVGGFLSLYSTAGAVALGTRDARVCAACREKGCITGNERAWGCPWLEQPHRLSRANNCGLCLECVKACPRDNVGLFVRPPFLEAGLEGWDEAFKAFLMLALALAYTAVYLGPWGSLKGAANVAVSGDWAAFLGFAARLWGFALLVVPGLFLAAAAGGRWLAGPSPVPWKAAALAAASSAVPLGLLAWIAFSLPLAFVNGSYVVSSASDPFGWGWDLLGTAGLPWTPLAPAWMAPMQAALVLAGQAVGLRSGWRETLDLYGDRRRALAGFGPTALLVTAFAVLLLRLQVG